MRAIQLLKQRNYDIGIDIGILIMLCMGALIFLCVSFVLQFIPVHETYYYIQGRIVTRSWHDGYHVIVTIIVIAAFLLMFSSLVICVMWKVKYGKKIAKRILLILAVSILCVGMFGLGNVMVVGVWGEEDYEPAYYEYTHGQRTIVVKETSFLLYGGGTIYQIDDDKKAFEIGSFQTDDGGRNHGNYTINWQDEYADITYHTFATQDSMETIRVRFL